jgi:hypothetical protein
VLTLAGSAIAEITWFADSSVFPHFALPRTLPRPANMTGHDVFDEFPRRRPFDEVANRKRK